MNEPTQPSLFENAVEGNDKGLANVEPELSELAPTAAFSSNAAFDSGDLVYPRVRLAQSLTLEVQEEQAKAGQFVMTGFEAQDQLTIVPGLFARRRMYMPEGMQDVACRSADGITGVGTPGGLCDACPLNQWTGSVEQNNRKGPACTFMYSYIVFVVEWEAAGILDFRKTSLNAGKTVNTLAMHKGLGNFAFTLKSIAQMNPQKQRFYTMSVVPAKVDADILSTARQFMGI